MSLLKTFRRLASRATIVTGTAAWIRFEAFLTSTTAAVPLRSDRAAVLPTRTCLLCRATFTPFSVPTEASASLATARTLGLSRLATRQHEEERGGQGQRGHAVGGHPNAPPT